ncbi:MAG TPA: glutathione binding-like protein [Kofleriaceae bacterium]
MKLYTRQAACSLSCHIAVLELGLPIDVHSVAKPSNLASDGTDFAQVNPLGYVPALASEDSTVILEAAVILQHLADQKPGSLLPTGARERLAAQSMLNFIATELHKHLALVFKPEFRAVRDELLAKVSARLDWLEGRLAPYALGATFSVADAYLLAVLNWTQFTGPDLRRWPKLMNLMELVRARPAVQAALAAEDLVLRGTAFFVPRVMPEELRTPLPPVGQNAPQ